MEYKEYNIDTGKEIIFTMYTEEEKNIWINYLCSKFEITKGTTIEEYIKKCTDSIEMIGKINPENYFKDFTNATKEFIIKGIADYYNKNNPKEYVKYMWKDSSFIDFLKEY